MTKYLLRDRASYFREGIVDQVKAIGIKQMLSAPRFPWRRAYVERVIGTIRRECLDHIIVFSEEFLYQHLGTFIEYHHRSRTHLALKKIARHRDRCSRQRRGESSLSRKSADCIIATSVAPPELRT